MSQSLKNNPLPFSFRQLLAMLWRKSLKKLRKSNQRFQVRSADYMPSQLIFDIDKKEYFRVKIRNRVDLSVLGQVFNAEDYRLKRLGRYSNLIDYYQKLISDGKKPLILDLGANNGMSTLYFSRDFPEAHLISLEPDYENYRLALENNLQMKNVEIINAGISSENGRGSITNKGGEDWAFRTKLSASGEIQMLSINSLLEKTLTSNGAPYIAKIDIEGFESDLFSKNTEWVDQFPLIIIELHDWMLPNQANSKNFLQCVSKLNRDFVFHGENVFSMKNGI